MMCGLVDGGPRELTIFVGEFNTNTYNVDLRYTYRRQVSAIGLDNDLPVNVTFQMRGNIGSTSTDSYALSTGQWPAGSTITLIVPPTAIGTGTTSPLKPANGIIGGKGGRWNRTGCCDANRPDLAYPGGPAILLQHNLTIFNQGVIGAGGVGSVAITQNVDNPCPGCARGGAGVDVGESGGGCYCSTDSGYIYAGPSVGPTGGDLGEGNGSVNTAASIVSGAGINAFTLTIQGSGSLRGRVSPTHF